jgi:hypothetical protein
MTGYAGNIVTLRVDLNQLRGNRIVTCREFVVDGSSVPPDLEAGNTVRVVEEEGDTYLAVVERVEGSLVHLWLDLDSWVPATDDDGEVPSSYAANPELERPWVIDKPDTATLPPIPA